MSVDNLYELLAQKIVAEYRAREAAERDAEAGRVRFARSLTNEPSCRHGVPGGQMLHPSTGWVACAQWRNRTTGAAQVVGPGALAT